MRIPEGSEFKNPEEHNRFSSVFVFHKQSKTIHDDDTIMYFDAEHLSCCLRLAGLTSRRIFFHPTLTTVGLYKFPEAVNFFKEWIRKIIDDWDFENVCTAHYGVVMRDGKKMLKQTLKNYESKFCEMRRQYSAKVVQSNTATSGRFKFQQGNFIKLSPSLFTFFFKEYFNFISSRIGGCRFLTRCQKSEEQRKGLCLPCSDKCSIVKSETNLVCYQITTQTSYIADLHPTNKL